MQVNGQELLLHQHLCSDCPIFYTTNLHCVALVITFLFKICIFISLINFQCSEPRISTNVSLKVVLQICGKQRFPSLRPIRVASSPWILKQSDQRSVHSETLSNWLQGSTVHGGPGRWTPFPHAVETNSDGDMQAALWTVYNYESALWHHPDVWINHLWLYVCKQRRVHMLTWHSGESWGTDMTAGRLVFDFTKAVTFNNTPARW